MKKIFIYILTLAVSALSEGTENSFYTIVAPSWFRPNSRYRMSLATTGLKDPIDVLITLTNGDYKQEKVVTVPPNSPIVAFLDVGSLQEYSENYELQVLSLNGVKFNESAPLSLITKETSILIQTDKAMYKPGDRVQFRVLVVDSETKPVTAGNTTIMAYILDPKFNKIKQWQNIRMENGVFSGDLKLSKDPVKGSWTLFFLHGSGMSKMVQIKRWEVTEYKVPEFEIITSLPVYNTIKSGKVVFGVEAKYTSGQPVKGTITVNIDNAAYSSWLKLVKKGPRKAGKSPERYTFKVLPIDGKVIVEIDVKELSTRSPSHLFPLTVLEELTGISLKTSISVPIYERDYQIAHIIREATFKPGLTYGFHVQVTRPDEKPMVDKENPVSVVVNYGFEKNTELTYMLDDYGMAFVAFTVPLSAQQLEFTIRYRDVEEILDWNLINLEREVSESNNFIQARILTKPMDIFKFVRVQVKATEPVKYLYYQVIGRSGVLASHKVNPSNSKVFVFRIWATFAMLPEADLVLFYYRANGEIIADRVPLKFENRLDNYANVKLSSGKLEPGKLVDITVDAKCNSYVGLLGIDQGVELPRSDNDINKKLIFSELKRYKPRNVIYPDEPLFNNIEWKKSYNELVKSGAIFFTNAKKYELNRSDNVNSLNGYKRRDKMIKRESKRREPTRDIDHKSLSGIEIRKYLEDLEVWETGNSVGVGGPRISIRQDFPETWIWEDFMNNNCDSVKLSKKVPNTITSWRISAFSLNKANGLGLIENPTSLTVFRQFFISTNLPYSVKRGERLTLFIQIFNYLSVDQDVSVTMSNDKDQFEFTDDTDSNFDNNQARMKMVTVKPYTGSAITFTVTPKTVGYLPIKIAAFCEMAGDSIEQPLLVVPEGSPIYVNTAVLLDMRTVDTKSMAFYIETPEVAVPDSTSASVSVFGDLFGNTIQNLDTLIRIPSGCGEQNMISFVPNLLVADYLTAVQQLTTTLRARIVSNLELGYQSQLKYQRYDGSFSCFGMSDKSGSTWLTAFVAQYFAEAKAYITIDENVINRALDWLVNRQTKNGRFAEEGKVFHQELQSDADEGVGLTAHVLLALMANNHTNKYGAAISKATDYIVERLQIVNNLYALSLSAYAMQKSGHVSAPVLLEKVNKRAIRKDGMKWWENVSRSSDTNIAITAIALATNAEAAVDTDTYPILQWLIKQRNSREAFYSTQDTIFSIKAMAMIASKLYVKETDIDVAITYEPEGLFKLKINSDNTVAPQSYELPLNTKSINFDCKGTGVAVAQVAYKYYVNFNEPTPRFNLVVKIGDSSTARNLNLTICTSFIADDKTNKSSMTIVEVAFPSGYTFNHGAPGRLRWAKDVSRVMFKELDTVLMVYYYSVGENETCFRAEAVQTSKVALLKPTPVIVYDNFDKTKGARTFYDVSSFYAPTE